MPGTCYNMVAVGRTTTTTPSTGRRRRGWYRQACARALATTVNLNRTPPRPGGDHTMFTIQLVCECHTDVVCVACACFSSIQICSTFDSRPRRFRFKWGAACLSRVGRLINDAVFKRRRNKCNNQPMTTEPATTTVTTMTGSPRRRRSTFYIPLQATARPVLAVARLVDAVDAVQNAPRQQQKLTTGRALSASALALLQTEHPPSHRPPSSPSSSRRSSPLAFIRRPSSRKLARSSSTIITTGRWLSSKATGPLRISCNGDSSSSIGGGDTNVVQQANRSPPIIAIEGSPDQFYRRRRRRQRRAAVAEGGDEDRSDGDDFDEDDDDNHSGQGRILKKNSVGGGVWTK